MIQCIHKYGIVEMVLWDCSSKGGEFHVFLVQLGLVGYSRVSKVRVGITVSIRNSITLVLETGLG